LNPMAIDGPATANLHIENCWLLLLNNKLSVKWPMFINVFLLSLFLVFVVALLLLGVKGSGIRAFLHPFPIPVRAHY